METYTNKPVTITAEQFDGTADHAKQLRDLINDTAYEKGWDQHADVMYVDGGAAVRITAAFNDDGFLFLYKDYWLAFGTEGEYYPIKDSVFAAKYEKSA